MSQINLCLAMHRTYIEEPEVPRIQGKKERKEKSTAILVTGEERPYVSQTVG